MTLDSMMVLYRLGKIQITRCQKKFDLPWRSRLDGSALRDANGNHFFPDVILSTRLDCWLLDHDCWIGIFLFKSRASK